jgi:hypothetical protein
MVDSKLEVTQVQPIDPAKIDPDSPHPARKDEPKSPFTRVLAIFRSHPTGGVNKPILNVQPRAMVCFINIF